jgi:hypothetical protein
MGNGINQSALYESVALQTGVWANAKAIRPTILLKGSRFVFMDG